MCLFPFRMSFWTWCTGGGRCWAWRWASCGASSPSRASSGCSCESLLSTCLHVLICVRFCASFALFSVPHLAVQAFIRVSSWIMYSLFLVLFVSCYLSSVCILCLIWVIFCASLSNPVLAMQSFDH